ncbi:MAG: hypothetical protein KJ767_00150 [Nanoarchaeota archaeon]|nr:hypothetical protein [Nanoarchaeota archaeon]
MKKSIILVILVLGLFISGCQIQDNGNESITVCMHQGTDSKMTLDEAKAIAIASECNQGTLIEENVFCNQYTGIWYFDMDLEKPGCNPECVVRVSTKQAEINWRCTGLELSKEDKCLNSGGTIKTSLCCQSVSEFPDNCAVGACGCAPEYSHEINICSCGENKCFNGEKCVQHTV